MALLLRPLRLEDEDEARRAHVELEEADAFPFLLGLGPEEPFQDYLGRLERYRQGREVPIGWVPWTMLGAFVGPALIGRATIRHELNDFLLNYGGHIGYCVRPSQRRRGYGGEILAQALVVARAEGVERVLVTCEEGNEASARVIEGQGGVLEDVRERPDGPARRRYWFD